MNREILFKAKRKDIEYEVIGNILMIKSCWRWSDEENHRTNY